MKTIGMIGGMSCESTLLYYQLINQEVKRRLGGHHNARSVLVTVDFDDVARMQHHGDWFALADLMADSARQLERAGADFIILCTNTTHKVAASIEEAVSIPLLHIADAAARAVESAEQSRVALLGTRFTMEQTFFRERLERRNIEVLIPGEPARIRIHHVIYDELVHGITTPESRRDFIAIIDGLAHQGAQAVILGCTEIGMLIKPSDSPLPLHDTMSIHATAAVEQALDQALDQAPQSSSGN